MAELRYQWKMFADEYIISGNIYKSAIKAGYSENYAKGNAAKLLEKESVKKYIDEQLEKLQSEKVAEQQEVLEFLTSVMRGEETEQTLIGEGMGEQRITDIDVPANQRIKAAELLGKRYSMWTDKQEVTGNVGLVQIIDDIPADPDG